MKTLGVEKYRYLATLDSRTDEICREMDGKVFTMAEYKPGVTAPPLHVWCRSTTVPYFGENGGLRAARNAEGKTEYIPDMDYEEWYNRYVKPNNSPTGKGDWKTDETGELVITKIIPEEAHYSTAKRGEPNSVVMHYGTNKQHDFDLYDENGFVHLQIHCGDHGNRKRHPFPENGEHAAVWLWSFANGNWKPTIQGNHELTDQERRWVNGHLKH